ncbi:hypothetical protein PPTG_24619, partial [Phytophthora nicotianae INRA-310]
MSKSSSQNVLPEGAGAGAIAIRVGVDGAAAEAASHVARQEQLHNGSACETSFEGDTFFSSTALKK